MNWLAMNGYGVYIWSAYGVVGCVFVGLTIAVKRQNRRTRAVLKRWYASL